VKKAAQKMPKEEIDTLYQQKMRNIKLDNNITDDNIIVGK